MRYGTAEREVATDWTGFKYRVKISPPTAAVERSAVVRPSWTGSRMITSPAGFRCAVCLQSSGQMMIVGDEECSA